MWLDDCFPRTQSLPSHSPLFWVTHKDRYLRQLLIADIERLTGRDLIVYFTDIDNSEVGIDAGDDQFLQEVFGARSNSGVDLLLETLGGSTDATEKVCAFLRKMAPDLRVIVPRAAKSNGTVIALAGNSILMSATSELGPIDPSVMGGIPAEFIVNAPEDYQLGYMEFAQAAIRQTNALARKLLSTGMMKEASPQKLDETIKCLASRSRYASHGSVIDPDEARSLGLKIDEEPVDSELWKRLWLLRSMYAYDCPRNGYSKVFETVKLSAAAALKPPTA